MEGIIDLYATACILHQRTTNIDLIVVMSMAAFETYAVLCE